MIVDKNGDTRVSYYFRDKINDHGVRWFHKENIGFGLSFNKIESNLIGEVSKGQDMTFSMCNTCQWYEQRDRNREMKSLGMEAKQRIEFRQVMGQWETRLERRVRTFCGGPRLTDRVCFYHKCNESCQGS